MKKFLLFIAFLVLCVADNVFAQLVGDQIFLQGKWLEVGVAPNGAWGNTRNAPAGYHARATSSGAGTVYAFPSGGAAPTVAIDFMYDPGHDGWGVGSPAGATFSNYYGPFFLPGTPFDGWAIQMNGVRSDAYYTSLPSGGFALGSGATAFSGTNVGYTYTAGTPCNDDPQSNAANLWTGSYTASGGTVSIRQINYVDTLASWDRVNIYFKNTGATTITGLYYFVTGDPDNDEDIPGTFPTNNHISYQNDLQHRSEVSARPPSAHQDAFVGLATKDCRAKAIIYQSWPSAITILLSSFWAVTDVSPVSGFTTSKLDTSTLNQDIAMGLVYNLGNLAPGDSTMISFAWIFKDTTNVDSAFQQPKLDVNCSLVPNSYTISPCPLTTFPVSIINGKWGTANWTWSPAIGLATTVGTINSVNVLALPGPTTYTITPTDTASCDHFPPFYLTVLTCFSASNNGPICVGDTLKLSAHGDSTGATYTWFGPGLGGPVLGSGQFLNIYPSTFADSGIIYVIKTVGGLNDTVSTHVIIKPLPVVTATTSAPICSGNLLNLFGSPASAGETFSWTGPNSFTSTLQNPTINPAPVSDSGIYKVYTTLNGCIDSGSVHVVIDSTPAVPLASNNSPVCSGNTLLLTSSEATPGVSYSWTGPLGFTSTLQNPSITSVTTGASGTYTVTATLGACTNKATTVATINPTPPAPTLGSNSPICSGTSLNLTATTTAGSTYSWTGPNGFSSTLQNPTINPATTIASGIYSVIATLNGCPSARASIVVEVDSTPVIPTAGSNTPVCSGNALLLTSTDGTDGVSYSWAGPGGFSSTLQNPTINPTTVSNSGTYTVTAILGICNASTTTVVVINPTPPAPSLTSNSPVCSGTPLNFTATTTVGSTFSWVGPNSFSSTLQNPTINPATTSATGVYSVIATLNGCPSAMGIIFAVVDSTPAAPLAGSNSPGMPSICENDTLTLWATDATTGVSYSWGGPNSFTSTLQNPVIMDVTVAANGQYTVTVSNGGICTNLAVITVSITAVPALTATNNGPVCTGDTLLLSAVAPSGSTYFWSGPYVFSSGAQNPNREPVLFEYGGVYQVTAFLNGCSKTVNDTVVVNQTPGPPWVTWMTYCQYYDAPPLQADGMNILWYPTNVTTVTATGTPIPPTIPTASDTVMWFYLTQTVEGCTSPVDSIKITIDPKPTVTLRGDTAICPHDTVLLRAIDADPNASYYWSPGLYLSGTNSATVTARPETNIEYTVVAGNQYGCKDTASMSISVYPAAVMHLRDDSVTLYPGEIYQISPTTNCVSFVWFPPAGLSYAYISDPVASPEFNTKYVVLATTEWGCWTKDSVNIYVDPESLLAVPNAFTPGSGSNKEYKILIRGIATLNYFRIWNRWGEKVFETTDINKGWDGTFNGTPQPMGVFIYQIEAVTVTGHKFEKTGNLTLIR